jgi:hypothetical protein
MKPPVDCDRQPISGLQPRPARGSTRDRGRRRASEAFTSATGALMARRSMASTGKGAQSGGPRGALPAIAPDLEACRGSETRPVS